MRKFPVTILLVVVNVLVFAGVALHQGNIMFNRPQDFIFMLFTGANFNPFTVDGGYWRLFTSMFMHWGAIHLAVNMYALYSIGRELEYFLGTWRFTLLYFITGVAAGLASLLFNLYTVSAGASGAVFGVYGYMIMQQVSTNFRNRRLLINLLINFLILIAINYLIAQHANVDTPAHIGGFVTGAMLAFANYFTLLIPVYQWAALAVILPLLVLFVPKDQLQYYKVFQTVVKAEDRISHVYNQMLTDQQRGDSLAVILLQLDSARDQLRHLSHVPGKLVQDTATLARYTSLRMKELDYRIRGAESETFVYLDSIDIVGDQLSALPPLKYHLHYRPNSQSSDSAVGFSSENQIPTGEGVMVYYDSLWREIPDEGGAHFYRLGTRDTLGRWQGDVRDYYINGNIQMKGSYLNNMHHGVFRYYSRDGKYEALGRYEKERAVGKWENYFSNGQLQSEIYYGDRSFTKSVWDSVGNQQVANGRGKEVTWHENGVVKEEGEYFEGLKEGNWFGYYPSGKPHYREYYRNGLLVRGMAIDETGSRYVYDRLSVYPFPEIGMKAYQEYLQENIIRPKEANTLEGVVKLTFVVDTDGSKRDYVITEGLCVQCDQEAIRLVKEGPAWRPGVLRGHVKILSHGYVEVYF